MCRTEVVLPKTPAARRRRKPVAKCSRTLRSTAVRDSLDSGIGIELEVTKKSQVQLDVVTEKTEEQSVTMVEPADSNTHPVRMMRSNTYAIRTTRSSSEVKRKKKENNENIGTEQVTVDSKQNNAGKQCDSDHYKDIQQTSKVLSSIANVVNTPVFMSH